MNNWLIRMVVIHLLQFAKRYCMCRIYIAHTWLAYTIYTRHSRLYFVLVYSSSNNLFNCHTVSLHGLVYVATEQTHIRPKWCVIVVAAVVIVVFFCFLLLCSSFHIECVIQLLFTLCVSFCLCR